VRSLAISLARAASEEGLSLEITVSGVLKAWARPSRTVMQNCSLLTFCFGLHVFFPSFSYVSFVYV
jgi:hypothetical protein